MANFPLIRFGWQFEWCKNAGSCPGGAGLLVAPHSIYVPPLAIATTGAQLLTRTAARAPAPRNSQYQSSRDLWCKNCNAVVVPWRPHPSLRYFSRLQQHPFDVILRERSPYAVQTCDLQEDLKNHPSTCPRGVEAVTTLAPNGRPTTACLWASRATSTATTASTFFYRGPSICLCIIVASRRVKQLACTALHGTQRVRLCRRR